MRNFTFEIKLYFKQNQYLESDLELKCESKFNAFEIYNCTLSFVSNYLETQISINYGWNNYSSGTEKFSIK